MTHYPKELKDSMIAKMLPPQNISVPLLAKETGIPTGTLYTWQHKARRRSVSAKPVGNIPSNEERFTIVLETASLNEIELGEYCRQKGIYPEHIQSWKDTFIQESASSAKMSKAQRQQAQQQSKTIQQLSSELHRKDKALAEAAALLILQKKFQALWTEAEDEKLICCSAKK
ncbi:MAG: hypothetical protein U9R29_08120 [Thermodesulfobacteriota bacterium]|nr:hypothetical protein [Thermodesulfobacteriota bacterium]